MQTLIIVSKFTGLGIFGEIKLCLGIMISIIVFPLQILFNFV